MDWLADHADLLLAIGSTGFTLLMIPTIIAQLRGKSSTIPLTSSLSTVALFVIFIAVYVALKLPIVAVMEGVQAGVWLVVAFQRWHYGEPDSIGGKRTNGIH